VEIPALPLHLPVFLRPQSHRFLAEVAVLLPCCRRRAAPPASGRAPLCAGAGGSPPPGHRW
jgi:hypothetical protein